MRKKTLIEPSIAASTLVYLLPTSIRRYELYSMYCAGTVLSIVFVIMNALNSM